MSLADELLADYEEAGGEVIEDETDADLMEVADVAEVAAEVDYSSKESVRSVAKLRDSEKLKDVMQQVQIYATQPRRKKVAGPVEADPEYQLIVEANNLTVEIDNEINVIHKFTRDHYSKRFPELESLVPMPMEYVRTVKELGNNILENSKNNEVLQEILTPATIMVVSVTASTTQGTKLTDEELYVVMEACKMAVELSEFKMKIFEYVESRMSFIAPNLSIIVGASIAAKLMGVAGGLTNLSKMPACNVLILGAQRRTLSGFSTAAIMPHTGFIYYSDTVQKTPPDLRKKAARLVSAKCTLAARVDAFHESVDGKVGDQLRGEIEQKLDKLQEPPPVKQVKALPVPIEVPKKKRGGRRARKVKERLGLSEMAKAANRMSFGEIEEDAYQDDLGFSMGTLGSKAKSGRIRGPVVDSKTKARISKTLQAVPNRTKMFNKISQQMLRIKWLTLLLTILTNNNIYSALGSSCNRETGPSGTIECIKLSRYNNEYQWATCLTNTYIQAKSSGKHICLDKSATFCYYQCMIEVYDAESGPVDKECCACQYGEEYTQSDLTLPSECYSPSGTNCGWYENCLERKYQCRDTEDDYAMEFATTFCNLYTEHFAEFSVEGQTWVDAVRKCLQVSLVPIIRPWCSKTCKEIKQTAFVSHVSCYVLPNKLDPSISMCNLGLTDLYNVIWTIKSSLWMSVDSSLEAMNGIMNTMSECMTRRVINPASEKIDNFILEMKIKMHNVLPFGRHRRSLSNSIDFLLLSNRIADNIAAKLHWSEKGVLWISTVDTNSNETLTSEKFIYIHLADRKTYDLNAQNTSSSDMKSIIQEFQSKVHSGDLNANLNDFSFEILSAKGCLDTQCNTTLFEVNATPNDNDDATSSKIYIIIGICSAIVLVIVLSAVGIFVSKRRKQ